MRPDDEVQLRNQTCRVVVVLRQSRPWVMLDGQPRFPNLVARVFVLKADPVCVDAFDEWAKRRQADVPCFWVVVLGPARPAQADLGFLAPRIEQRPPLKPAFRVSD